MLIRLAVATLGLTLLVSCGGAEDAPAGDAPADGPTETDSATEPSEEPTEEPHAAAGTSVVLHDSQFGPMLFDESGQAIYLFDVETTSEPECYDACAEAWPPVLTEGEPVAGRGLKPGLLGTTKRTDGTVQVTYGGHPLYFYAHEGKHEVLCHDVFLNGGNWYVVQADGSAAPPG
ncbi:hypothetical protein DDE18_19790 [Nocardioides gansuensis]|uniref:Lipoprotein n=1 Tax=Nocardioides gansuensis TaxID=2138300 RepID=A0A2T8F5T2_9ACTN|nr:hypothetical protein [Nocardioides gansuensis]PVG81062.1 hypothetical protein DDE18_19790 [Nocardioides gansuensis]